MSEFDEAFALHRRGKFSDAERCYVALLRKNPREYRALRLLGVLAVQVGQTDRGIGLLHQSLALNPNQSDARRDLGNAFLQKGMFEEALANYEFALALKPDQADIFNNRAIALAYLRRIDEALTSYNRALSLKCSDAEAYEAHNNRGTLLVRLRRFEEALADFDRAIAIEPSQVNAIFNRGGVLVALNRPTEALECCDHILAIDSSLAAAHDLKGTALSKLNRLEEAIVSHDKAIALNPSLTFAHLNRGTALTKLGRHAEALKSFDDAIDLDAGLAIARANRAGVLHSLGRLEEALESHDFALKLDPNLVETHVNRGQTLADLGSYDEALASFERALVLNPQSAEAQFGRATTLLIIGRFSEGWQAYEWRRQRVGPDAFHPSGRPQWSGREDPFRKTVFVEAEQGMGDTIQFCRYLRPLLERGARVVLTVRANLVRLLQSFDPSIDVRPQEDRPVEFDYHIPLMSLPMVFGGTEGRFLTQTPYLAAEPEKLKYWRNRIGQHGFKVGICWHAGPTDTARSFPLSLLCELGQWPGIRFISLQKGAGSEQLESIATRMKVEALGPDYDEGPDAFIDAAAAMDALDLIITCDTALAHLAGALAKPVWVALKYAPDWRYLLNRNDSVWYPTMRLFRQNQRGSWHNVFANMAEELGRRVADKHA